MDAKGLDVAAKRAGGQHKEIQISYTECNRKFYARTTDAIFHASTIDALLEKLNSFYGS